MYSPKRKRKRKTVTTTTTKKPSLKKKKLSDSPPTPIPSLPDDLLISIFARVSRVYYPTLSLVSKSFRSLIASPELYETRSLLGRSECCLYLCLQGRNPDPPNPLWFTHCLKPDRTLTKGTRKTKKTKKKSRGNILIPIPVPNPPLSHWSGPASVGSDIYFFGGYIENVPSSRVLVLDCRSHTLREAPSMQVERLDPSATVIDGNIYVAGGNQDDEGTESLYPIEIFDSKTQIWDHIPVPNWEQNWGGLSISAYIEGKFCLIIGSKVMAYDREVGRWDFVGYQLGRSWFWPCNCTIDDVLYCYGGAIRWYDTNQSMWKNMKGLKGLPKFGKNVYVKLVDYGGKMAAFWDNRVPLTSSGDKYKTIWCAVIALERPNSEEIWGKVEWYEAVLTVPVSYEFEHALAVTV
ncbi:PREDICTED: F-box/kelch-repeat protein At4g39570-like [Camelina sativa]|uniref:F-box/kelch-repeat protein At4g39570-like n=1 Tax=Camelina sativa TaxID=90675 RepID=A0ABM1QK25_CAMSA|nr:PREDICTED: F-box/kelch-repeat protein At4g39570-like [Camelina sativa]